jgi:hypothetical protein
MGVSRVAGLTGLISDDWRERPVNPVDRPQKKPTREAGI